MGIAQAVCGICTITGARQVGDLASIPLPLWVWASARSCTPITGTLAVAGCRTRASFVVARSSMETSRAHTSSSIRITLPMYSAGRNARKVGYLTTSATIILLASAGAILSNAGTMARTIQIARSILTIG